MRDQEFKCDMSVARDNIVKHLIKINCWKKVENRSECLDLGNKVIPHQRTPCYVSKIGNDLLDVNIKRWKRGMPFDWHIEDQDVLISIPLKVREESVITIAKRARKKDSRDAAICTRHLHCDERHHR